MKQIVNAKRQNDWDTRAACNFMAGGTGTGLLIAAAIAWAVDASALVSLLAGASLVGFGLFMVWLEIGKPWRFVNVFFHPHTSWMTREAIVAMPLMAICIAAWLIDIRLIALAALFAAAFLYCQARILRAAKGIPAWCQPEIVPLIITTGLAEGAGAYLLIDSSPQIIIVAALLAAVAREIARELYRRGLVRSNAPSGTLLWFSRIDEKILTAVRILAIILLAAALSGYPTAAIGGLLALLSGWALKFILITKVAFLRGPVLPRTPTRGRSSSGIIISA